MPASRVRERQRQQKVLQALLRQLRTEAGFTQVQVAEALGRPQSYVSNYENGERKLDIVELRELCGVLGVSLRDVSDRLERDINAG